MEIRLPIDGGSRSRPALPRAERAADRRPSRLRVLIVEDNLDAAEMLDMAVSQTGPRHQVAHDGATAITVASSSGLT